MRAVSMRTMSVGFTVSTSSGIAWLTIQSMFYFLTYDNADEFGQWRPACNRFGAEYLAAYHAYTQISPPEEDYEGRLDLYKL